MQNLIVAVLAIIGALALGWHSFDQGRMYGATHVVEYIRYKPETREPEVTKFPAARSAPLPVQASARAAEAKGTQQCLPGFEFRTDRGGCVPKRP